MSEGTWSAESPRTAMMPGWFYPALSVIPASVIVFWILCCIASGFAAQLPPDAQAEPGSIWIAGMVAFFGLPWIVFVVMFVAMLMKGPRPGVAGVHGDHLVVVRRGVRSEAPLAEVKYARFFRTAFGPQVRVKCGDGRLAVIQWKGDHAASALMQAIHARAPSAELRVTSLRSPLVFLFFPVTFVMLVLSSMCLCPGIITPLEQSGRGWVVALLYGGTALLALALWLGVAPGLMRGDAALTADGIVLGRFPLRRRVPWDRVERITVEGRTLSVHERSGGIRTEGVWLADGLLATLASLAATRGGGDVPARSG